MVCIICGKQTAVTNSRPKKNTPAIWRRRQCEICKTVFSTWEKPDLSLSVKVAKNSGVLEPFSEDKLYLSVYECLSHRKDAYKSARELTATIVKTLLPINQSPIDSNELAGAAYQIIRRFDKPAAVYYKSHHPIS